MILPPVTNFACPSAMTQVAPKSGCRGLQTLFPLPPAHRRLDRPNGCGLGGELGQWKMPLFFTYGWICFTHIEYDQLPGPLKMGSVVGANGVTEGRISSKSCAYMLKAVPICRQLLRHAVLRAASRAWAKT